MVDDYIDHMPILKILLDYMSTFTFLVHGHIRNFYYTAHGYTVHLGISELVRYLDCKRKVNQTEPQPPLLRLGADYRLIAFPRRLRWHLVGTLELRHPAWSCAQLGRWLCNIHIALALVSQHGYQVAPEGSGSGSISIMSQEINDQLYIGHMALVLIAVDLLAESDTTLEFMMEDGEMRGVVN